MPKFITENEKRISNIPTNKLFSFLKSWGINLTNKNFQERLKKYNSLMEIEKELTSAFDPVPFHINRNLQSIIVTLWNRLIEDKLLIDHVTDKLTDNIISDEPIDNSLWDELSAYIDRKDIEYNWKRALFNNVETVDWLNEYIDDHYFKTIESGDPNIFLEFDKEFAKIDWKNISEITYLHFNLVSSLFYKYENETGKSEKKLSELIGNYPEQEKEIHKVRSRIISESLDFIHPIYKNEWNEEYEISREKGEVKRITQELDLDDSELDLDLLAKNFSELMLKMSDQIISEEDQDSPLEVTLICWECGLVYCAITDHLILNSKNFNKNISHTSIKPDNGTILFPLEVRCPTCNGYKFVVREETKMLYIGFRLENNDKRISKLNFHYSKNKYINSFSESIADLKRLLKRTNDKSDIYIRIGNIYRKMNYYDLAKKYYLKANKDNSKNPDLYFNLGEIYLSRNDMKRANYCFKQLKKLDKKYIKQVRKQNNLSKRTIELLDQL